MSKKYLLSLTLLSFCLIWQINAQEYLELIQNPTSRTTIHEVQQLAESYFENIDKGRGSGYKQYKRWEHRMERLVNEDGLINKNFSRMTWDAGIRANAINPSSTNSRMAGWMDLGPTSYTNGNSGYNGGLGRVGVVAFHPTDANTLYVGTPAGGMWKSTNGGSNWSPMSDALASIGVSGIAVDHTTPNTVYILTGDGDGGQTKSIGVMKSIDGGATWATTGLSWGVSSNNRGYKLLMHPTNSSIMLAVTTSGILKTNDGWATWSNVQGGSFRDIEFKPGDPTTMYASTTATFYRSTDTGSSWGTISSGLPTGENRAALGVSPANSNYVYYLAGPATGAGSFKGIFRSTDSGLTFSAMATTPNILGYPTNGSDSSSQSSYDLALAVNPSSANNIITGGINVWRSTDGGVNNTAVSQWNQPTGAFEYVHADIHELTYNPVDGKLYVGSDGGVSVSSDNGQTFTNIWDGLQIMQFYRIAGVEANPNLIIGGTQDNGTNVYSGSPNIQHIYGADGMDCVIDYNNNSTLYFAFQGGGFRKSTNGGTTSFNIKPGGSSGAWVTPYAMDANSPSIIYGGFSDVYRSANGGSSWTNLGSDGRGALAIGTDDPSRLYAAVGSGIQMSANTGGSWTTVTGSWPGLTITFIAVDPNDAQRVWITLGGYTAGQKVYESTNAGTSWTNISGTLPNVPALSVAHQDTSGTPMDAIYVGMDVGVYYQSDVTPWQLHETGLPNTPIYDLEINETNQKIIAGTFGRGLWEAPLFGAPTCDLVISNVTSIDTSCPTSTDGIVTIVATCTTCVGIDYTLTPLAPPGAPITQSNNASFTNLAANSYDVSASDPGDPTCIVSWATNPIVVNAGSESTPPMIMCNSDITQTADAGLCTAVVSYTAPIGTDNCPGPITTQIAGLPSGSAFPVGITTNAFQVVDSSGNAAFCGFDVIITDFEAPVASCQNITIQLDSVGMATILAGDVDGGSTDNCGITAWTIDQSTFDCSNVGPNNVILTIADAEGNMSTCTAIVTVEDIIPPAALCQDITIQLDATGNASILPADIDAGSTDACGIDTITATMLAFDCTHIGPNNVDLIVTDINGNTSSCTAVVTVEDIEAPVALCQDITAQLDALGMATIVPADVDGGSTDNCGVATTAINIDTFDCTDVGVPVAVTLTVTDTNGNMSNCAALVTVEDTVAPVAICQDITIQLDSSGMATIVPANVDGGSTDACGIGSLAIDINTFDCSNVGPNNVTLSVSDVNGNIGTCIAVVTVEEENAVPVAVCSNLTVPLQQDGTATITPDQVDGGSTGDGCVNGLTLDISTFDCSDIGTPVTVTLTVTNGNGMTASCTALITVVDTLSPVVTCPADQTVDAIGQYILPDYFAIGEAVATDNCTIPLTILSQDPAPGTALDFGVYTIEFTATDDFGQIGTCEFVLTVDDALGVETVDLSSLILYPNPVLDRLNINNPNGIELTETIIYDMQGRIILTEIMNAMTRDQQIDLSSLQSATYIVRIIAEQGQIIKYLVKE